MNNPGGNVKVIADVTTGRSSIQRKAVLQVRVIR